LSVDSGIERCVDHNHRWRNSNRKSERCVHGRGQHGCGAIRHAHHRRTDVHGRSGCRTTTSAAAAVHLFDRARRPGHGREWRHRIGGGDGERRQLRMDSCLGRRLDSDHRARPRAGKRDRRVYDCGECGTAAKRHADHCRTGVYGKSRRSIAGRSLSGHRLVVGLVLTFR